jgi:class 3 adenylate cyclase
VPDPAAAEADLGTFPIFAGVPPALWSGARRHEYRRGDEILADGSGGDRLIVLVRGEARIEQRGTVIAVRRPGHLLGEQALIDGSPRSACVVADGAVVTREFNPEDSLRLFQDAAFRWNLVQQLSKKLREATSERAFRYASEERLFGAFRSHVSGEILDELQEKGDLGGPRRTEVVAMFADVRDFTTSSIAMEPAGLMADLGRFLELGIEVVQSHDGMIDKLIGDEVMALWGFRPDPQMAAKAVDAAVELVERSRALSFNGRPLRIGVGLEIGTPALGVVGSKGKSSFTAIGPSVNAAARLQGATKEVPAHVCIGPALRERLPEQRRAQLAGPYHMPLKGMGETDIYTLCPREDD